MNVLLVFHIKILRNNFFLILSNIQGKILFTKNAGSFSFRNIKKKSIESFKSIISNSFKFIFQLEKKKLIFLKLEGPTKKNLREIYKYFILIVKKYDIKFFGLIIINKIAFNGCKKRNL